MNAERAPFESESLPLPAVLSAPPLDPLGPIYFVARGDRVHHSRSLRALQQVVEARAPDPRAIGAYIGWRAAPDGTTHFRPIRKVRAVANAFVAEGGEVTYDFSQRTLGPQLDVGVDEAAALVRATLERVVARACEGLRKVSILASGGLDSSVLVGIVADLKRAGKIEDYLVCYYSFEGPGDDRPFMRDLAQYLGFTPHVVEPREAAPYVEKIMVTDGFPDPFLHSSAEYLLNLRARDWGSELMLTGMSGDQLFEGDYELFSHELTTSPLSAVRRVWKLDDPYYQRRRDRFQHYLAVPSLVRAIPKTLRPWRWGRSRRAPAWHGEVLREIHAEADRAVDPPRPRTTPTERFHDFVMLDARVAVARQRSAYYGMTGLVRRDPFQNLELVELVSRLPPMSAFVDDRPRGLYRRAIRGLVPRSIENRNTKAYFEPIIEELFRRAGGPEAFAELAHPRRLAELGLVDEKRFAELWQTESREGGKWLPLWPVICAEKMLREEFP